MDSFEPRPPAKEPRARRAQLLFSTTSRNLLELQREGYHRRTTPSPAATPLLKKGGDRKEKGGPFVVVGPPPSNKLRAFFLFYGFSLIFSGGACGWLRAVRRGRTARLRPWRFPACPSRGAALPRRPSGPRSPWPRPSRGRGPRCRRARSPPRAALRGFRPRRRPALPRRRRPA